MSWWLLPLHDAFQQKFLSLFCNVYYTWPPKIYWSRTTNKKTTAANDKAIHCQYVFQKQKMHSRCEIPLKRFSSVKASIRGRKFTIVKSIFSPWWLLLIICTFMIIHLQKSGLPWNENRSQEDREGMSTSGTKRDPFKVAERSWKCHPCQNHHPFDVTGLKSLRDSNTREIQWRRLERIETITSCPYFLRWKINL